MHSSTMYYFELLPACILYMYMYMLEYLVTKCFVNYFPLLECNRINRTNGDYYVGQ